MALTKQDIIRQIQQGKVQSALQEMVQVSGLARDKELQQRCVLLQSQLSQLNTKFGMGTFDNKTYQLELNRITQASLEMAYEMPSVVQAPPQYGGQAQQSGGAQQSGSVWKTWGILLTGGGAVLVLLIVIALMMEQPSNEGNAQSSSSSKKAVTEVPSAGKQDVEKPVSVERQASALPKSNPNAIAVINDPDGYTNVRSGEGTTSEIVAKIYTNEEFYVEVTDKLWWRVETGDGVVGYIRSNRVEVRKRF